MAATGYTDNLIFGVTRSPYDTSLTPGGSSGGATASVASGMTTVALGTDSGGSIRSPASLTGLYGLRPTNGRVARAYGFPPLMIDFQAIGLLARTPADLRLLYDHAAGPDDRDPVSRLVPDLSVTGRPVRIGWFVDYPGHAIEPEIAERVATAAAQLQQAGAEVVQVAPPYDLDVLRPIQRVLRGAGIRAGIAASPDPFAPLSPPVRREMDSGFAASAADFAATMRALTAFRRDVSVAMAGYDVLLLPTTPTWAWPAAEPGPPNPYTSWVNAVGYPGLNVPVAPLANGLPIGVQLVARAGGDRILLDLAEVIGSPMPIVADINITHQPLCRR